MSSQPKSAIRDHLKEAALQDRPHFELTDTTDLLEENILDSLGIFSLIAFLEERFGTRIEAEDVVLENFETVCAIAELVHLKQTAGS